MPEEDESSQGEGLGFNPEYIMLFVAGLIDMISVIPIINFLTEMTGICVIGLWILMRGGRPRKGGNAVRWMKRLGTGLGEAIPGVSILPLWTMLVYSELKS